MSDIQTLYMLVVLLAIVLIALLAHVGKINARLKLLEPSTECAAKQASAACADAARSNAECGGIPSTECGGIPNAECVGGCNNKREHNAPAECSRTRKPSTECASNKADTDYDVPTCEAEVATDEESIKAHATLLASKADKL